METRGRCCVAEPSVRGWWSGRGRAGAGRGAPEVGDRRWRSEDDQPQDDPRTTQPTTREQIHAGVPPRGFP